LILNLNDGSDQICPLQSCTLSVLLLVPMDSKARALEALVFVSTTNAATNEYPSSSLLAARFLVNCVGNENSAFKFGKHSVEIYNKSDLNGDNTFAIVGAGTIGRDRCQLFRIPFDSLIFKSVKDALPFSLSITKIRSDVSLQNDLNMKISNFELDCFDKLHTCAARGIAVVSSLSKVSIFDLEEEDEEGEEVEEDEEEG